MDTEKNTPSARPVRRRRRLYETPNTADTSAQTDTSAQSESSVVAESVSDTSDNASTLQNPTAVALATPSEQAPAAEKIVRDHMWWSMALGLIPLPLVDVAIITGLQVKMLHRLSTHYQQPFSEQKAKAIIAALMGGSNSGFMSYALSSSLGRFIPLVGWVSMSLSAGALTYAVGRVFVHHFELGGTFLSFDVEAMREHFAKERENGLQVAQALQ